MNERIYIVSYRTCSSQPKIEGYWTEKPTDNHLETYFRKKCPDEFYNGVRNLYWNVYELNPQDLPKKSKKVTKERGK